MKSINDLLEGLVDDEAKARVMETHIKATEETKRSQANSDNYQFVRGMGMAVLGAMVAGGTCVSYRMVDGWQAVHEVKQPETCTESVIDTSKYVSGEVKCPSPGQKLTYPPGWTWAKCSCPENVKPGVP